MKTEPDVFSFNDLWKAAGRVSAWEGVRNYQARNFMRDSMRVGDQVLIYHSSCEVPGVAGLAEVSKTGLVDQTANDPESPYFDQKSSAKGLNPWMMVEVRALEPASNFLSLEKIRSIPALKNMLLLKRGMRLSIQPVTAQEFHEICKLAGFQKI